MDNIYTDGEYLEKNPGWGVKHASWKAKQINKILNENNIAPTTVCEVGCGAGEILTQLCKLLPDTVTYYGYDISPQAFELCQQRITDRIAFYLMDLFQDNNDTFDVALSIDVFEHVEDYYGFLRKFRKEAEYKIFHIPLDISVQTVARGTPILFARTQVGHIHYFTKETALAALKDTGYEIIDYFYTKGALEVPNSNLKTWLLKFPRSIMFGLSQDLSVRLLGGFSLLVLAK